MEGAMTLSVQDIDDLCCHSSSPVDQLHEHTLQLNHRENGKSLCFSFLCHHSMKKNVTVVVSFVNRQQGSHPGGISERLV
jgi:hypothetical protein